MTGSRGPLALLRHTPGRCVLVVRDSPMTPVTDPTNVRPAPAARPGPQPAAVFWKVVHRTCTAADHHDHPDLPLGARVPDAAVAGWPAVDEDRGLCVAYGWGRWPSAWGRRRQFVPFGPSTTPTEGAPTP